jgi:hypothetical protein
VQLAHNDSVCVVVDLKCKIGLNLGAIWKSQIGESENDGKHYDAVLLDFLHVAHLAIDKVLAEVFAVYNLFDNVVQLSGSTRILSLAISWCQSYVNFQLYKSLIRVGDKDSIDSVSLGGSIYALKGINNSIVKVISIQTLHLGMNFISIWVSE